MISTLPLTFVTIVEKGSITLAADELGIAKSAVSQNLKRLENQLGVKLANRTTRKMILTPTGERYYLRCKEVISLSKVASTEMENFGAMPSGPIIITAPHVMIAPVIAPAISSLISKYPEVCPTVIAEDMRLDLVSNGIDIAITVGELENSSLKCRKIGMLRDVLCISSELVDRFTAGYSPDAIKSVQALPYIAHTREPSAVVHRLIGSEPADSLVMKFKPTLFGSTVEALTAFVRAGLGVAVIPDFVVAEDLRRGDMIKILPNYKIQEKPIYAVHPYANMPPKSILGAIKAIQNELEK